MSQPQPSQEPKPHNGKAEGPPVDLRSLLHPKRVGNEHKGVFDEFLNSNKNNPTKSRIPNPAGMMLYQKIGIWASCEPTLRYEVQGKVQEFPKSVAGMHDLGKRLYDENAISHGGKSREEAKVAALGYYLQDIESIQSAQQTRLGEKGGASKSK